MLKWCVVSDESSSFLHDPRVQRVLMAAFKTTNWRPFTRGPGPQGDIAGSKSMEHDT